MWQKRVWCFGTRSLLLFLLLFNKSSAVGESADPHIELKSCTQELEVLPNSDMTCTNKQTDTSKQTRIDGMSDLVTTCQLKCKPGYSFSYNTTADFLQQTCDNITGLWSGQTANNFFGKWGDICTKSTNPISRTSTTTVYMAQQDGIEEKCPTMGDINTAISTFTQDKISLLVCVGKDTCEPVNEKTECEVTRPPKDSLSINQLANVLKITFTYKQKGSLDDAKVVQYFAQSIDYLVSNGEFILHFTVSKKRATVKYTALTDVTTSSNTFICSPGFGKIGDYCTECPRGYFLNAANDNCQGCDKGTYSDTEASLQCKTCPNNLGTFLPNSTSITDCVKPCTVKKTNNGTVLPEVEWEVTTNTQVYITCNTDHALTYQADKWYICSDEAPHCYKICTLDPIPDNVMLVHPDTNASTLVHGNKTTVACVDFIAYHTVTCNDGNLNWPVCKSVNYSAIGIRIWVLFGAVLVLGIAFIIFFTVTENLRRTKTQEYKGGNYAAIHTNLENPMEKPIISLPIHVEEFSSKVEALNRDLQRYRTEYQLIPLHDSEQQKLIGMASWNRRKNNTEARGIVPYDVSRVLLTQEPDQRFYYNASYINGWKGPKHYIAAQTPLSNTRADFWRLICDTNMSMFINLHQSEDADNPTEYSKYWPDHDGLYDGILVRKMSEIKYNGFIIREFKVGRVEDAAEYFSKTPTPMPPGSPLTGSIAGDEVAIVDSTNSMAVDTPAGAETLTETKAAETEDLPNTDTAETESVASVTQDTTDEKEDTTKKTTANGLTDNVGEEGEMGAEKGYIAGRVTVGSTEESDNKSVVSKATTMTYRRRDRHQSRFSSVPSSRCSNYATKYNLILDWDYSFMLKQVVFTGWNEDGTPDMEKFRNMIYVTRDLAARDIGTSPRLVHSDVGSDWASIYIAVDYTLDRLISKTDIDICGLTNALRQQRPVMVTTVESYIYLYNFVNNILSQHSYEDMKYGGFVLKVEDLPDEQSSTSKPQPGLLEEGAQSVRAFSRATMRSVEQGRQSVVQSVSRLGDAAMSIFGSISNSLTASSQQQLTKIEEE